ncbi:MAG: hypothetical protein LBD62_05300 [Candidatus Margulisbacteria bacterium]|jgi:hypothetical protein|nr:hypothetical protein [Candidatus Margulisiibacteriota bacterium]
MLDNRFLQEPKIKEIVDCIFASNLPDLNDTLQKIFDKQSHCRQRDIFNARLDNFRLETNNHFLIAVCGEIGNNTFDHNSGDWRDIVGLYFHWQIQGFAIFLDCGKGVRKTLSSVVPNIASDKNALQIAFTERVSGRSPEKRGNGLKFVAKVMTAQKWDLYFQSGTGFCEITNGNMSFGNTASPVFGCLALLKYS